jgi:hypothetical protein
MNRPPPGNEKDSNSLQNSPAKAKFHQVAEQRSKKIRIKQLQKSISYVNARKLFPQPRPQQSNYAPIKKADRDNSIGFREELGISTRQTTEREGFEPSLKLPLNSISSAAPSTTRPPLPLCNSIFANAFSILAGFLPGGPADSEYQNQPIGPIAT